MEENPRALWNNLKQRYEQHKVVVLPEASHEWNYLRLQDFKTVDEYNHAVHRVCQKLRFCGKEPPEAEKIEKILSTMLPSEIILTLSYREKNFTDYALLILTLRQAEKNHVITIWNSQQRPMGTAPLPEVHANIKKSDQNGNTQSGGSTGKGKRKRTRKPRGKF
ncbi:uncharacterized protein LOC120709922 [Panicum virgatum]|uniref:uncharacterized protein LOC120709922 n=1 Tax=Panicum virgatum TaxID=38727 RepID=UPI0019D6AA68|nr:uncharacterized protein LOC120709922 [Panicum virgatum]